MNNGEQFFNTAAGGYAIERSLRFNSADSAYLSRTPASAGNRKTWTWAGWVKRADLASQQTLFDGYSGGSDRTQVMLDGANFRLLNQVGGSVTTNLISTAAFRDASAWYHLVVNWNTPQATSTNRVKVYVNGIEITAFSTATYPGQNNDSYINSNVAHDIGRTGAFAEAYFSGYLADIHFIDGQALDPTSFGEFSATTGVWVPKAYTGTYGTNGFQLKLEDNSSNTATTLGKDTSGLGNHWLPNNLSIITGGPTSVASASGALPVYNTTDTYGTTKGTGTRSDSNASSLVLAIPMDGANNGTTFTDESATIKGSGSAKALTRSGNTKTSTTQSKYYGSSGSFDGTDDYLLAPANADFQFGSGNLTIETWFYPNTSSRMAIYHGSFGTDWSIGIDYSYLTQTIGIWASSTGTSWNLADGDSSGARGSVVVSSGRWHHIAMVRNGSNLDLYVNGVLDKRWTGISGSIVDRSSSQPCIGTWFGGQYDLDGYLQDFRIYKGVAKYTSNFNPPSSTQNATLAAGNDSLVDVPTNGSEVDTGLGGQVRGNYCCWNPLDANSSLTISNGNLELTNTNSTARNVRGTIAFPTSGKWYYEITPGGSVQGAVGIGSSAVPLNVQNAASQVLYFEDGSKGVDASRTTYGASYSSGTVIGVAFDADLNQVTFYKNNVSQGAIGTTAGVQYFPFVMSFNATYVANFGQRPFAYTAPSGFKALCTANLPAPLVTKPSTVFDVKLYTGNGSTQTISGLGFSPDLVWIKGRSSGDTHRLYDVIRGNTKALYSALTVAEGTYQSDYENFTAFNSDGFGLGAATIDNGINKNASTYAAWCWDAGSSTVTNTQGSITSQVRANASAGFSVVTYTGNGSSGATVGHGLGVAPRFLIGMDRTGGNWQVWGANMNNGSFDCVMNLNTTDALATGITTRFRAASSTTYTIGTDADINSNGNAYVTYCFAPVAGYSAMGSWQNNGSNDGTFVYLGFRPKFILLKNTDNVEGWYIMDSSRHTYNVPPADATKLQPNLSDAEGTGLANTATIDFLSNGFKIRTTNTASGEISFGTRNYIYAAFAESPFAANNRAR